MPLNGAGTWTPPPGTTATPNTTILSAAYNALVDDLTTVLNTARPVAYGGTGGTSVITGWDGLAKKGTDIATASSINLTTATGPSLTLTGVVTVTAVTLAEGSIRLVRAAGAFQITASASLLCNGSSSVNMTVAAEDLLVFRGGASSVVSVARIGAASVSSATTSAQGIVALNYFGIAQNIGLAASVGSSALTVALKGADGNDPSASNPVVIPFRNVTAATGTPSFLTVTAATSVVISSGSTLGLTNAVAATLAIVGFNDGGTFRLGLINPLVRPLNDGIASSTAEGGAGAADSAGVIYTGTAVTSKAMTVLGYATITEATAGTWATAPATLKLANAGEVNNVVPIITPWVAYTPTFTGFGTVSSVVFRSRRVGDTLQINGKFVPGTSTATEARITMGFNGVDNNVVSDATKVPSLEAAGNVLVSNASASTFYTLVESAVAYLTIGLQNGSGGAFAKQNGNAISGSGITFAVQAEIPISGW